MVSTIKTSIYISVNILIFLFLKHACLPKHNIQFSIYMYTFVIPEDVLRTPNIITDIYRVYFENNICFLFVKHLDF